MEKNGGEGMKQIWSDLGKAEQSLYSLWWWLLLLGMEFHIGLSVNTLKLGSKVIASLSKIVCSISPSFIS